MIDLKNYITKRFKKFGVNKKRELTRLVYEISKRDKISPNKILAAIPDKNRSYAVLKKELLTRRFPYSSKQEETITPYLPKLEINPENAVTINKAQLYPKNIYIEEPAYHNYLAARLKAAFPLAKFKRISSLKDYIKELQITNSQIANYNKRRDNFFIIKERYDFFKRCPCTKSAAGCGYHIFNLGFGCIYECTYCYLQEYTNCPGIILPSNIEDFFMNFTAYKKQVIRIGTGEFTDSLALDNITQYSAPLVEFFSKKPEVTFEFKTKSSNIDNLLNLRHGRNIIISWSLNPEKVIKENEFYSASLEKRLTCASDCVKAGYRVGFHFDPIIYYKEWAAGYKGLVNRLFDRIPPKSIAWISLGTLRFNPRLKPIIENRFPKNRILDEELFIGFDNKLRYPAGLRHQIYKNMFSWIGQRAKGLYVYLCMEDRGFLV